MSDNPPRPPVARAADQGPIDNQYLLVTVIDPTCWNHWIGMPSSVCGAPAYSPPSFMGKTDGQKRLSGTPRSTSNP
jgi:hypothetical protein